MSIETLTMLATVGSNSGTILRITNASRLPRSDLFTIAAAGRGCILFEG